MEKKPSRLPYVDLPRIRVKRPLTPSLPRQNQATTMNRLKNQIGWQNWVGNRRIGGRRYSLLILLGNRLRLLRAWKVLHHLKYSPRANRRLHRINHISRSNQVKSEKKVKYSFKSDFQTQMGCSFQNWWLFEIRRFSIFLATDLKIGMESPETPRIILEKKSNFFHIIKSRDRS